MVEKARECACLVVDTLVLGGGAREAELTAGCLRQARKNAVASWVRSGLAVSNARDRIIFSYCSVLRRLQLKCCAVDVQVDTNSSRLIIKAK